MNWQQSTASLVQGTAMRFSPGSDNTRPFASSAPLQINKGLWLGLPDERVDAVTVGFGLAVIAAVFVAKKMPVSVAK